MIYPKGTILQHRDRYIFVKRMDGKWEAEHRIKMRKTLKRDFVPGERVYHINGKKDDNRLENLVLLRFSVEKIKMLPKREVLFMPKGPNDDNL